MFAATVLWAEISHLGRSTGWQNSICRHRMGLGAKDYDNTSGNSLVLQAGAGNNMKVTGYNYNTNTAVPLFLSVDEANYNRRQRYSNTRPRRNGQGDGFRQWHQSFDSPLLQRHKQGLLYLPAGFIITADRHGLLPPKFSVSNQ